MCLRTLLILRMACYSYFVGTCDRYSRLLRVPNYVLLLGDCVRPSTIFLLVLVLHTTAGRARKHTLKSSAYDYVDDYEHDNNRAHNNGQCSGQPRCANYPQIHHCPYCTGCTFVSGHMWYRCCSWLCYNGGNDDDCERYSYTTTTATEMRLITTTHFKTQPTSLQQF